MAEAGPPLRQVQSTTIDGLFNTASERRLSESHRLEEQRPAPRRHARGPTPRLTAMMNRKPTKRKSGGISDMARHSSDDNAMKAQSTGTPATYSQGFVPGDQVVIDGLMTMPCYNGCLGTVQGFDERSNRWEVAIPDNDSGLLLRSINLVKVRSAEGGEDIEPSEQDMMDEELRLHMQESIDQQVELAMKACEEVGLVLRDIITENMTSFCKDLQMGVEQPEGDDFDMDEEMLQFEAMQSLGGGDRGNGGKFLFTKTMTSNDRITAGSTSTRERMFRDALNKMQHMEEDETALEEMDANKATVFADSEVMKQRIREAVAKPVYNVSEYYHQSGFWQAIARSPFFENITLLVISLNALWIAVDAEYNDADVLIQADLIFFVMENLFCSFFFCELIIRFCAFKRKIYVFHDAWFVFDAMLMLVMVFETWVLSILFASVSAVGPHGGPGTLGSDASVLKIVRLIRLTRMARLVRLLRALPELMVLVRAILVAFRSVFFTLCLLVLIVYVFAIAFTQLTAGSRAGKKYFNGVLPAMSSLLLAGNLPDHADFVNQVGGENFIWSILLMVFVLLAPLTLMGMLSGILVEVVSVVSTVEKETQVVQFVGDQMFKLLKEVDKDGNGTIDYEEFLTLVLRPDAARMMSSVGVDVVGLTEFCDFLFLDRREIPFECLMNLVLQLRGSNTATVKDIVDMRKFIRQELSAYVISRINRSEERIMQHITQLDRKLPAMLEDVVTKARKRAYLPTAFSNVVRKGMARASAVPVPRVQQPPAVQEVDVVSKKLQPPVAAAQDCAAPAAAAAATADDDAPDAKTEGNARQTSDDHEPKKPVLRKAGTFDSLADTMDGNSVSTIEPAGSELNFLMEEQPATATKEKKAFPTRQSVSSPGPGVDANAATDCSGGDKKAAVTSSRPPPGQPPLAKPRKKSKSAGAATQSDAAEPNAASGAASAPEQGFFALERGFAPERLDASEWHPVPEWSSSPRGEQDAAMRCEPSADMQPPHFELDLAASEEALLMSPTSAAQEAQAPVMTWQRGIADCVDDDGDPEVSSQVALIAEPGEERMAM
eukprot:TRINITY_DN49196_c0_g1_i1.p1 TRINITY_DN49196_c0_g1~~TRINITY_DN49196_c0_g1_i1.p1  ORF type:complete len:1059 (+),score=300.06 TRINITY_DN49196_c0_g1_i1:74-3250(+)